MKTIPSTTYYIVLGIYLAISGLQRKSKQLEETLDRLLVEENKSILDHVMDLAFEGADKDSFDMMLKQQDVVVFDTPKDENKEPTTVTVEKEGVYHG